MHVLVCTIVHHPQDARILHRQIRALLDAGHEVSYIAPLTACGVPPDPRLTTADVPRAVGRHRLRALRGARRQLARLSPGADLLIVHDPELLLVLPLVAGRPPTVWDVHEDTAAALRTKAWLPAGLRPVMAAAVRCAERIAERWIHLILAEHGYASRFRRPHPVVPNAAYVPDDPVLPGHAGRVVYIGHLSPDRGSAEMIEVGRLLRPHGIVTELIGPADAQARAELTRAQAAGLIRWHGFLPNDAALLMCDGALAGLSLLHDQPNFRHSLPTKVAEYMARGVPVITSPLPVAAGLVARYECGTVVPFRDPRAAADAVLRLAAHPDLRAAQGMRGHRGAAESLGWPAHAPGFVAQLEQWAARPAPSSAGEPAAAAAPPVQVIPAQAAPVQVSTPSPGQRA
jgi:glycosyltransferase involved in cell wall biosynthesis